MLGRLGLLEVLSLGLGRRGLQRLHRERDPLGFGIGGEHLHLHYLPHLHHVARVLHVAVRQFAHVDQAVLMHPHVHERPEARHVGHHTLQRHAGFEVRDLLDVFAPLGRHEFVAGVAPGLAQFFANVAQRVHPHRLGGEPLQLQVLYQFRTRDQLLHGHAQRRCDFLNHSIRFRMYRSDIQRVLAAADA